LIGRWSPWRSPPFVRVGDALVDNPLAVHQSSTAAKLLANFLNNREPNIRKALERGDLAAARKAINGGLNGLTTFEPRLSNCTLVAPEHIALDPPQLTPQNQLVA
jgi:predicted chitinase